MHFIFRKKECICITLLLTLPWLNPFAPGPMPGMVSWLVSGLAVAGLLGVWALRSGVDWPRAAAGGWLLAGVLSSGIGLVQYLGDSAALFPWVNTTPVGEAFANLRQRNQFASLVTIALAALLWWVVQPVAQRQQWAIRRGGLAVVLATLLGIGNAVSASRTGLVQLGLLVALTGLWGGWRHAGLRRVLLANGLAYGLALLLLPLLIGQSWGSGGAWARLQAGDALCSSRLTLWRNVLDLVALHPWRGWGWGRLDYAHYVNLYDGARFCDILDNAHNLPLHLAVELGVPTALALCGLLVVGLWRARPWRETDATRQLAWSVLALVGLHSLLEYPLWYGPFQIAVGMCAVLLWRTPAGFYRRNRALASILSAGAAIILIAFCSYTAWDYYRVSQVYLAPAARDPAYREDPLLQVRHTLLFQNQVQFAALFLTPLTPQNAVAQNALALDLLYFSPERKVAERVIDSALLLGDTDLAAYHLARLKAAFPQAYADWLANHPAAR